MEFEHFFKVLSLYLEARIRIRIKVKGRIRIKVTSWIRIRINVTSRIRIPIKVTSWIRIPIKVMRIGLGEGGCWVIASVCMMMGVASLPCEHIVYIDQPPFARTRRIVHFDSLRKMFQY
jgi:hypothetical protein